MSKFLCTFSGKYGDILWSLATAKRLSELVNSKVDFAIMPTYCSLLPLLQRQSYIDQAYVVPDWHCAHSNHGDQPWNPPVHVEEGYTQFWHLGYRGHPGISDRAMALIDYIAYQQGVSFIASSDRYPLPFIETPGPLPLVEPYVAYAFNEMYSDLKLGFINRLQELCPEVKFVDVSKVDWQLAAAGIERAMGYVGCRSANYVLAHGVGQRIICYEPHPARNQHGHLGNIFGCPYGEELGLASHYPVEAHAQAAAQQIQTWKEE